jgi:hypothetical protein
MGSSFGQRHTGFLLSGSVNGPEEDVYPDDSAHGSLIIERYRSKASVL